MERWLFRGIPHHTWANNETGLPDSKVPATPSPLSVVTVACSLEVIKRYTRWFSSGLINQKGVQNGVLPSQG